MNLDSNVPGGSETAAVLALDVGSSSVRASLYGLDGEPLAPGVKLDYGFDYSAGGAATVKAQSLLELVATAIDRLLEKHEDEIVAVALSTFWHSMLGLDGDDHPTTPVLSWADRRASSHVPKLRRMLDSHELHGITGCPPHSSYWPAKILWMNDANPQDSTFTRRFVSPGEYIYLNLFGKLRVGTSMASATGLYDRNENRWSGEVLESLGLDESVLSEVSDEPFRGLRGEWAARWPRLAGIPWFPAVGDGACSNIGSGCIGRDRVALMVGTSGAMRVAWAADSSEVEPGLWCYRVDAGRFVSGGALSDGGALIRWVEKNFRVSDRDRERAEVMEPDAHGLTLLPLLSGERGPGWSDRANGVVAGLSMATTPAEILRAAMESVAFRFALISSKMSGISGSDATVVASGGGLVNSGAWVQIMADVLNRTVEVPQIEEASSRGAALLALETLGHLGEDGFPPSGESEIITPDPEAHEIYREALHRHRDLYENVIGNKSSP